MIPLHQERFGVKVFLKVMLLFHTLAHDALNHLLHSRPLAAVDNVTLGRNYGARGVVVSHPAQHAGHPGFNPQRVQFDLIWQRTLARET